MPLLPGSLSARSTVLAIMLLGVTSVGIAPSAQAAPKAKLSAKLSTPSVVSGQSAILSGKVSPAAKRTVRLERQSGKRWMQISSTTSSKRTGAFTLAIPSASVGTVTVRASIAGRGRRKATVSPARTLTVTAPVTPPCCKNNSPGPTPTPAPTPPVCPGAGEPARKPSFRAIYALASDQLEVAAKGAAITPSVNATNAWFATQTVCNVQPRWVRDGLGAIVITTVRLPRTAADYAMAGFPSVVAELEDAAPTPRDQKSVVWFDVGSPNGCGVTGNGFSILFEAACDIHPSATDVFPYGATYLTAHEMTHNFGAVAACAPHSGGGGHVNDDPKDLLYSGTLPRVWASITLDPGRDDYYATGNAACPGIASSPYWTATSDPLS